MKHLTREEMRTILTVAKSHSERDWLIILVAYLHGLRASEVVGLRATMRPAKGGEMKEFWPLRGIDIQDGNILVRRLKGSLKTDQPLVWSDDTLFNEKLALETLAVKNPGILFPITRQQFWNLMQKYGLEAGIAKKKSHPHICKHSIITHAVEANVNIGNVKQHAGHRNLSSTGAYLNPDDETASKAVAAGVGH